MEFDHHKFLVRTWGDPDRLVTFLHGYGHIIPRATVNQWFRRGSIPTDRVLTLLALLEVETGARVDLKDYLI